MACKFLSNFNTAVQISMFRPRLEKMCSFRGFFLHAYFSNNASMMLFYFVLKAKVINELDAMMFKTLNNVDRLY